MFWKFFQSRWFTALAIVAAVFMILAISQVQPQGIVVENRVRNLQDKIAELEKSNAGLSRFLGYFQSPEYLEREAKAKLNVRRPDEQMVLVYQNENQSLASPSASTLSWKGKIFNLWQKWQSLWQSLFQRQTVYK